MPGQCDVDGDVTVRGAGPWKCPVTASLQGLPGAAAQLFQAPGRRLGQGKIRQTHPARFRR